MVNCQMVNCQSSRHLHLIDHLRDNLLARDVRSLSLVTQSDAMAQHVVSHGTNVLWHHVAPTLDERIRTSCFRQVDRRTGRTAERNHILHFGQSVTLGIARGKDDVGDVRRARRISSAVVTGFTSGSAPAKFSRMMSFSSSNDG